MGGTTPLRLGLGALLLIFSAAAGAQNALTTEFADLYAGPDDSYPVVAELDSNTPIQVMGCLDDWSWCDVAVGDSRGWLYSPAITYEYEGGYVPLYTYAPSLGIAVVPFSVGGYWDRYYHDRPWYSRREEWEHRSVHHRRPAGPPPSAGPPPRPDQREGPREATRPDDRSFRIGSAEPRRHDVPEHQNPPPRDYAPDVRRAEPHPQPRPEPRMEPHAAPPPPAPAPAAPPHEDRARAAPHVGPPPGREERSAPAGPPPGREHEDHPR